MNVVLGRYNSESIIEGQKKKIRTIIKRECILKQGWIVVNV